MGDYLGELAALGTATLWAFSSIAFTFSGLRVGSLVTNRLRLLLAVLLVGATHWALAGTPIPSAEPFRWGWLALSAVIGLVAGDSLLFKAFVLVGTRIGMLLWSLSPIFSALIAWLLMGEKMAPAEIGAMLLALGGMAWVVLERPQRDVALPRRLYVIGVLAGIAAAFCQAAGLVTAKFGLVDGYPALSATLIRMVVATLLMWGIAVFNGQAAATVRKLRSDPGAGAYILIGAMAGPFLGVWLSLVAVQAERVGVASTLMAMTPVLSLPLVHWFMKEQVSPRAVAGTIVAIAGIAIIMLV